MHPKSIGAIVGCFSLALVGSVSPAAAAQGDLQCYAYVTGVTAKGVPATFRYEAGVVSTERRGPDDLGYQPRDVAYPHYVAGAAGFVGHATQATKVVSYWFTLSGPQLREVTEVDRRDIHGRLVSSKYTTRVIRKNWGGARQISIGKDRDRLYVLTNTDQLLRYRLRGKDGETKVRFDQVVGVGFGSIGTFEYARTITALGLRTDVFLATDADSGQLLEFAIPRETPSSYTRTVLSDTGWSDMRSAGRTASCVDDKSGKSYGAVVTVGVDRSLHLWTDRDPNDGDGTDISEWGVLKSTWKPLAYSD